MEKDPLYTSVCSAVTLQSHKQGFFQDYANHVSNQAGSDWLDGFGKLKNDKDRLLKCYTDKRLYDVIHGPLQNVQPLFRSKSAKISQTRRVEGERAIDLKKFDRALLLLTQSVMQAPYTGRDMTVDEGLTLTLALWHRSTALLALEEYSLCLTDIQQSIKEKLPQNLRLDAFYRMALCFTGMEQYSKAKVALQVAQNILSTDDYDWKTKINEKLQSLEGYQDKMAQSEAKHLEVTDGPNSNLPNASSLIKGKSSPSTGRYAVAQNYIKTGDTLIVEPPYAACLLPDKFGSHCHHCFKRLRSAYPCKDCGGIAFCSIECRDVAFSTYHQYECKYMDFLIGSGMSILCYISLRIITQQQLTYWMKVYTDKVDTSDFTRMMNLVAHEGRRPNLDFVHRTLMSMFLLQILKCSGYFPGSNEGELSEIELYIGTVLLRLLQMLQFNAHEIYETLLKADKEFRTSKVVYIGVGIYPTVAAYFNHDCYPACARYFSGKDIVLRAVRPLAPGEVVPENYGPVYCKQKLIDRTRSLASRYWFECICDSCKEDWPIYENMDEKIIRFRCKTKDCKGFVTTTLENKCKQMKCPNCKQNITIADNILLVNTYLDNFMRGMDFMDKGELDEATAIFSEFSDNMHKICKPPFKKLSLSHVALTTCWANSSNTYIV